MEIRIELPEKIFGRLYDEIGRKSRDQELSIEDLIFDILDEYQEYPKDGLIRVHFYDKFVTKKTRYDLMKEKVKEWIKNE